MCKLYSSTNANMDEANNAVPISAPAPPPPPTSHRHAQPLHIRRLQRMLDINPFLQQLEALLSSPIKIPGTSLLPYPGSSNRVRHSVFSVKGIWANDEERRAEVGKLYNLRTLKKRKWLKSILLEESDSDSDGEQPMTEQDLHVLLKIHRCRRKYQKKYHGDILNSQYTYYGAGLLSEQDRFPSHQTFVQEQYGFGALPEHANRHHSGAIDRNIADFE